MGINNWVYHRNEAIFGPEARDFRPERWLPKNDSDAEHLGQMNRNNLSVRVHASRNGTLFNALTQAQFGAGARTCIGRHIAQLQMSKLIPRLVTDFEFELVPELQDGEWRTRNFFFLKPDNFRVRIKQRPAEENVR